MLVKCLKFLSCIVITPIILPLLLIQGSVDYYPQYIECVQYKKRTNKFVKYDDIPHCLKPNYLYYNSYKDKISIIVNNNMCFAYKHIDKETNKIVYVTENNETIIDSNLEQYKINKLKKRDNHIVLMNYE